MDEFIKSVKTETVELEPEKSVFQTILDSYEKVLVESLLTAFALDFMKAEVGGDVDTIHNVRTMKDENGNPLFKNQQNNLEYENRGEYCHKNVEGPGTHYQNIIHEARVRERESGQPVTDAYESKDLFFRRGSKNLPTDKATNLDHVLAAKQIHDDPGRVLSGISTKDMADDYSNLKWTNEHLNKSMGDKDIPDYIDKHPELSEETKERMMNAYNEAKDVYESRLIREYYFNLNNPKCQQFYKDTCVAAAKQGIEMGITQVVGFILAEIWIVTKEELLSLPPGSSFETILKKTAEGIKKGFESACLKYKVLIQKFGEGFLAGGLSSLITTLCNIFTTTSSFFIKNLRQILACITRSFGVLLINPDDLEVGDRIKLSMIIMATGASAVAGNYVGVYVGKAVGSIPVVGPILTRFCTALVTGLLSVSFLIFMDRSKFINDLVDMMNRIPSEVTDMKEINAYLDKYAAELSEIDIEEFKNETDKYCEIAEKIMNTNDDTELNSLLLDFYKDHQLPWTGDFDSFMSDRNNQLVFE